MRFVVMPVLLLLGLFSMSAPSRGEVPGLVAYQGVLIDDSGQVVPDSVYVLAFRIYSTPTGGTAIWSSQDTVQVQNGVFSVFLGENLSIADAVFDGPDRWLETELVGQGPYTPRARMATVPYAFRAGTVDGASGGGIMGSLQIHGTGFTATESAGGDAGDPASSPVLTVGDFVGNPGQVDVTDGSGVAISANGATGGFLARGAFGAGVIPASGAGTRLMWYPGKSALRAGRVAGSQWDDVNVGSGSVAFGTDARASGLHAAVGGGNANTATAENSSIDGGESNSIASAAKGSAIGGGEGNTVSRPLGTIAGGMLNNVDGDTSVVGGGALNLNSGYTSVIAGGFANSISTISGSSIGGGHSNQAAADWSTIAGGSQNRATASYAAIGGGAYDSALGYASTVPGGYGNRATGRFSFAAGRQARATHHGAFVWADSVDAPFTSTGTGQFLVRASGGVGIGSGFNSPSAALDVDVSSVLSRRAAEFRNNYAAGGVSAATVTVENTNPVGIAINATANSSDATVVINNTTPSGTLLRCFGPAFAVQFEVESDGDVGIGTDVPSERLQVLGDIKVGTSGTNGCIKRFDGVAIAGTCASDSRLKKDIRPFEPVLDRLVELRPVRFRWNVDAFPTRHMPASEDQGLIAQEVEKLFPDLVTTDDDGFKAVHYHQLPLLAIQAISELKRDNDRLRSELRHLEERMAVAFRLLDSRNEPSSVGTLQQVPAGQVDACAAAR